MSYGDRSRRGGGKDKNPNVLFLSKNTKRRSENSPPYNGQGSIVVPEGARPGDKIDFWLGAWVKQNDYGDYFYITLTEKEQDSGGGRGRQRERGYDDDRPRRDRSRDNRDRDFDDRGRSREPGSDDGQFDDDIPF